MTCNATILFNRSFSLLLCIFYIIDFINIFIPIKNYIQNNINHTIERIKKSTFTLMCFNCLTFVLYDLLFFYSKMQILFNKFCNYLAYVVNVINLNTIYTKNVQNEICQVSYDAICIKKITNGNKNYFQHTDNCIYIFIDNTNTIENKCVNYIILREEPFKTEYEVSNVRFILLELTVNNKTYKIDLKTDKYNYYIVDNIFDKLFFIYFLSKYLGCNLTKSDIMKINNFTVKIIDQNIQVEEFQVTNDKFITIKKDIYII